MNRQGGSILLLVIGALLMAASLVIQEVRLGENRRVLHEWNSQAAQPSMRLADPVAELRDEVRLARRGAVWGTDPTAGQVLAAPSPGPTASEGPALPPATTPSPPLQGAGFRIRLPSIGLDWAVMPDIGDAELALGPGHYPGTALPGMGGNLAIAGHRTHRGKPSYFYPLNRLSPGDPIIIEGTTGSWTYQVETLFITSAYNRSVLDPTAGPTLTLTTCDPPGTEDQRLIVRARLVSI